MRILLGAAVTLLLCSSTAAFAQGLGGAAASDPWAAENNHGTAAQGDVGSTNQQTSDVTMTENNNESQFFLTPPSNTTTSATNQNAYQGVTANVPGATVQTGLMAPAATMQYSDTRSFNYVFTCGFPAPLGVTGPGSPDPQGQNWSPGGNIYLPDTGTPSVNANVTIGGGY